MTTKALTPEEFHKLVEHGNLNDICEAYDRLYESASKPVEALKVARSVLAYWGFPVAAEECDKAIKEAAHA